jgi:hypothetical protein
MYCARIYKHQWLILIRDRGAWRGLQEFTRTDARFRDLTKKIAGSYLGSVTKTPDVQPGRSARTLGDYPIKRRILFKDEDAVRATARIIELEHRTAQTAQATVESFTCHLKDIS